MRCIWTLTDSFSLPLFVFLSHTHTHNTRRFFTHMLWRLPALWECLPSYLANDRRPPAPPEQPHCARSLSHWSQFSVCGQSHIAHIVAASSPIRWGTGVCSGSFSGRGSHHMLRSYRSLWKQAPHLLVPVRN